MKPIFISKDFQDLSPALAALVAENKLTAQSLIDFQALPFACPEPTAITFFGSIRAAAFYLQNCKPSPLIAVAGKETARKLKENFDLNAVFIAEESGNPELEAARFNDWRANRSVLFPSSSSSLGTYAKYVPLQHKTIIQVYQTKCKKLLIEDHQVYVFSSPSNVTAFFQVNKLAPNAIVVAWGKSTQKALYENKVTTCHTLLKDQQGALLTWLQTENFI
jgi:uroporphyrinogen-III synthase